MLSTLNTPVVLLIYKRPSTTEKVFEAIRQAKPSKLLVVANAPRPNRPDETENCQAARAIIEQVDWNCEVLKNYAESYLSCRERIVSGLNWVFDTVERAIILEDDCVPDLSFFRYCEELLDAYQDDERIMTIAGTSYQIDRRPTPFSYYFSRYNLFWGWATWRRAWTHYDVEMTRWPEVRDSGWLDDILDDPRAVRNWRWILDRTYHGHDTWDDQWVLSSWIQHGLSIIPTRNLVSNIGFGSESSHTKDATDWRANVPVEPLSFPLTHPEFVLRDAQADRSIQTKYYNFIAEQHTQVYRVRRKMNRLLAAAWLKSSSPNTEALFL